MQDLTPDPQTPDPRKADADDIVKAAAAGRPSRAKTKRRAALDAAYAAVGDRMIAVPAGARTDALRELAEAADLNFGAFIKLVRESTLILDEGTGGITLVGNAVRIARMIEAVRLRDPEAFLRFASFKDVADEAKARGVEDKALSNLVINSWHKDGSLVALSDLIGSATRNKVASHKRGFPGHSDSYYSQESYYPTTESFANLAALAGAANPYWWELTRRFTPRMAKLFRQIIKG